jgi:subtilisin family serine protease
MKRFSPPSAVSGTLLVLGAALLLPALALPQGKGDSLNTTKPEDKADSLIAKQQALFDRLNVAEAWKITKGDPKVLVGVLDNGFDYFHPDLKGQLIPGFYYPDGYHTEFYENVAHGTLVASLIVAKDNNPTGMVGLAPSLSSSDRFAGHDRTHAAEDADQVLPGQPEGDARCQVRGEARPAGV